MRRTASRSTKLIKFYVFYTVATQLIIFVTFVAVEPQWHRAAAGLVRRVWSSLYADVGPAALTVPICIPVQPKHCHALCPITSTLPSPRQDGGEAMLADQLRWTAFVFQMLALLHSLTSYYTVVSFVFVVYSSAADMYDVIGRGVEVGQQSLLYVATQYKCVRQVC